MPIPNNEVEFEGRKVRRRFTYEWAAQGIINVEQLPRLVESLVSERRNMVDYISQLHSIIDNLLEKNNCCDVPSCFTANCMSSDK